MSFNTNNDYLDTKIGQFNKDPSVATIYIGNLVYDFTEIEIKDLFEEFGYVNYVKIVKDSKTHQSTGIGFVQMAHQSHARQAIRELDGSSIDDRKIKVSIAKEQDQSRTDAKAAKKRRKPYKAYVAKAERAVLPCEVSPPKQQSSHE
ncbi:MAG: hypothetical protein HON90_10335 [Halobacteriovoraceae bacterium]|jgi:RNA recognition motif-containing protein|nr:hypothetical protein [Halobacteriovoraceae bacterium]